MTRFLPLIFFFTLTLVLAIALLDHPRREVLSLSGSVKNTPLPTLKLATRDGKTMALKTKGEVTWINFFASWCTPCVGDHQQILELSRTHPSLALHGIAWNDSTARIDDWLVQHRNPFRKVWFDTKGKAAVALGVRGMPESFLVDKRGVIRYHIPGPLTQEVRETIIAPLATKLMEEP